MFDKIIKTSFSVIFILMVLIPLMTTNLVDEKVSESENRKLAAQAKLFYDDGTLNKNFIVDFENWLNDNIGFRDSMVVNNARIQFYGFKVLANNSDMYLGPHGELNYATEAIIKDYQHNNLYDEDYLRQFAESMQAISDYVEAGGGQFYYYQCWDKHSVYPEYFPRSILQHGNYSKTDGLVDAVKKYSNVNVISSKNTLIQEKNNYNTYSVWGDPTHWSRRGSYIGYIELMREINKHNSGKFRILHEDDYNIVTTDVGATLFGGIHIEDFEETLQIKNSMVKLNNELLTLYADDKRHSYRVNDGANNEIKTLVIADSYFNSFIINDISESFSETVLIWGDYLANIKEILDTYKSDIVILEMCERVDRSMPIIEGASDLSEIN